MAEPKTFTLYEGSEEWSALYVDGKLSRVGDNYWVMEQLLHELGIEPIQSDDFLRGGNSREEVAQSLEEIQEYQHGAELRELEEERDSAAAELEEARRALEEAQAKARRTNAEAQAAILGLPL